MHLSVLSLASLVATVVGTCSHGTVLQKRVDAVPFGYGYDDGPMKWHQLSPDNKMCKTGRHQSPIDLNKSIPTIKNLSLNETGSFEGNFENLGTTLQVTPLSGSSSVTLGEKEYLLKQFHFHSPSEHRINGESYALEMHMVHQSSDNQLLVLGILFDISASENRASQTIRNLADLTSSINFRGKSIGIDWRDGIDLSPIIEQVDKRLIQTYAGSLTTPPCSEGVTWAVYPNPFEIDVYTYNAFKKTMKYNARFSAGPPGSHNPLQLV